MMTIQQFRSNTPDSGSPAEDVAAIASYSNDLDRGLATGLAESEERILRCLGAAVIMQWNTLPKKLQKELFENASTMGELLKTEALKGQIARFLHNHKDDHV